MLDQLKTLYHILLSPIRGETQEERLDSFYAGQAGDYDAFRERMLHGRDLLFAGLPMKPGADWVDIGAGTGRNGERWGDGLGELGSATFVDLSRAMLEVADARIAKHDWTRARTVHADATQLPLPDASADLVTFSYSLSMVPDWFAAIDEAFRILRPGGAIGVADFYVSRRYPAAGLRTHSYFTRNFWPVWFGSDNVHPSPDHLPMLRRKFRTLHLTEGMGNLPWMPILRAPYYVFVGQRA